MILDDMADLKLIWYLYDPDDDLVRVAIFVKQAEFHHRVIALDVALHVNHLIILKVFLDFLLENKKCVCKVYFKWTWIVSSGLHLSGVSDFNFQISDFRLLASHFFQHVH